MTLRAQLAQELKRFFTFPAGRPTDADLELIIAEIISTQAVGQSDVERIVLARIPQTRVHRFDGLTFQDLNVLLALIRAQVQAQDQK